MKKLLIIALCVSSSVFGMRKSFKDLGAVTNRSSYTIKNLSIKIKHGQKYKVKIDELKPYQTAAFPLAKKAQVIKVKPNICVSKSGEQKCRGRGVVEKDFPAGSRYFNIINASSDAQKTTRSEHGYKKGKSDLNENRLVVVRSLTGKRINKVK